MYTVSVRDHFMVAHSFHGEAFGPAQRLHGATYVVDLEFCRPDLDGNGMVVDIGLATEVLRATLAGLNYRNLDEEPAFTGRNTTTEFLARELFDRIVAATQRARWDTARRMRLALSMLTDSALDVLITGESDFDALPEVMAQLATVPGDTLCHRIRYRP